MRKFTEKVNIFIKKKWRARYTPYLRVYLLYFFGYLFFFAFRPSPSIHLDIPLVNAAKTAVDHTGIYAHIKSRPIDHIDDHIREISESLQHVIQKHDYECLAAIHISIPMRLIQTKSITLLNPSIVSQGSETSQAYETSAFFPNRPPVLMTRFVPVVLSYQNMDGVDTTLRPNNASLAHCLLHMLNQLDGENIYDQ